MGPRGFAETQVVPALAAAAMITAATLCGFLATPSANARVEAPPVELLPGLNEARPSNAAGVGALQRYLPKGLRRKVSSLPRDSAAAAGADQRVQVTLLETRGKGARQIVAKWGRGAKRGGAKPQRVEVGSGGFATTRGSAATVVWRSLRGVGVVQLRGQGEPSRAAAALAFARLADADLSAPPPPTAWERVLDQVRPYGGLSKQTAMQAFSLAYGRLPGVRVPKGPRGEIPDGSLAIGWIMRYYSTLSGSQRRAVDRALGVASGGAGRRGGNPLGFSYDEVLTTVVGEHVEAIGANLPPGARLPANVGILAGTTQSAPPGKPNVPADAAPINASGQMWTTTSGGTYDHCRVRVHPKGLDPVLLDKRLAHEAFHCIQFHIIGPGWPGVSAWRMEGMADWAALKRSPLPFDLTTFPTYIKIPRKPLYERAYDAVGFFGHIDDTLGEFWPRVAPTLQAATNDLAFEAAGGSAPAAFTTWGSSLFRDERGLPAWQMSSPIEPPDFSELNPGQLTDINGLGLLAAKPRATAQAFVAASPERPLLHVLVDGTARMLSGSGQDLLLESGGGGDLREIWLCAQGDCTCPAGTEGGPPPHTDWTLQSLLAVTGPSGASVGDHSLDEFCEPPPLGSGDPLPCSPQGCGSSNGDPHLATFDRLPYDFQAAGEFTLVKSPSGDLEVQARQEPARTEGGVPSDSLSLNTAFAMRVAGSRVGVYAAKTGMEVRVDGQPVATPTGAASLNLPNGGVLAERAGQLAVVWPDGSEARVWSVGTYGVAIMMLPAPSRAGELVGLLGDFDGDQANDFATRAGDQLDASALLGHGKRAFKQLYRKFGDSWRIRQADSLFDYKGGRSTRTYTKRGFPGRSVSVGTLPPALRRRAKRICQEAGVTDATVFANCILDVGATGDSAFARDAVTVQATASRSGRWRRLSEPFDPPGGGVVPSLAAAGDRVVGAYRRGDTAIEAATFTPTSSGATDVSRTAVVDAWSEIGRPFLLPGSAGNLQLLFDGEHSANPGDPLNGVLLAQRQPDGTFGQPARATQGQGLPVMAATADSGVPIWATPGPVADGPIRVWRGSQNATIADLGVFARGLPADLARDSNGRVWLAWEQIGGAGAGLYMGQLNPATGAPAPGATPRKAPANNAGVSPVRLACAAMCRLVFSPASQVDHLVSWAPGEAAPTEVAAGGGAIDLIDAAAAPDGRLWAVWAEFDSTGDGVLKAKLGDSAGAGGSAVTLQPPAQIAFPAEGAGLAMPGRLALAVYWISPQEGSAVWATAVPEG